MPWCKITNAKHILAIQSLYSEAIFAVAEYLRERGFKLRISCKWHYIKRFFYPFLRNHWTTLFRSSNRHQVAGGNCAVFCQPSTACLLVVGMVNLGLTCASIHKRARYGVTRQDVPVHTIEDPIPCWVSGHSLASAQAPINDAVLTHHSKEHSGL